MSSAFLSGPDLINSCFALTLNSHQFLSSPPSQFRAHQNAGEPGCNPGRRKPQFPNPKIAHGTFLSNSASRTHFCCARCFWPLAGKFNTNCHICLFFKGGMWCPLLEGTSPGIKATPAPASKKYLTPFLSLSTCCCPQAPPPAVHSKQGKASHNLPLSIVHGVRNQQENDAEGVMPGKALLKGLNVSCRTSCTSNF